MTTSSISVGDPILVRALRAVGRTRALGLHFYGHFIGMGLPGDDHATNGAARLSLEGEPDGVGAAHVSPVAVATLADLALGAAVRSLVAPGARLGTATLAIQHPDVPIRGPVFAEAGAHPVAGDQKNVRCSLVTPTGRIVGYAQGWFAALPSPHGRPLGLMPWERRETVPVAVPALADLDEREAAAVAAARAAGERAQRRGTAVSEEMLHFEWQPSDGGRSHGTLAIGPEIGNRVGHIQGGALYGAAALAATRALGVPSLALVDGAYQFLRPADGATLIGEGTVLRRGRSAAFVEARLSVDERLVGTGLFSFRLDPSPQEAR
ncbi:MAG: hypothetical protein IT305_02955 [Chloroflexi bacterium]|nr:hypothetical protein [Chloroflexota bacterium]